MNLMEAINARRSVRSYKPDMVDRETIKHLLHAAVQAPSGMNTQPWAFGIIEDAQRLSDYSGRIKAILLDSIEQMPWLAQYKGYFADPGSSIFYHAPTLVVIYTKTPDPISQVDCTLAAENLMLAACDMGLGTCWIGFSNAFLNMPEVKRELGVHEDYTVVAPIIVGHPEGPIPVVEKSEAEVLFWK